MTHTQHAAIAEQAYFLWLDDGMIHGRAETHWAAAEKLLAKDAMTAAAASKPKAAKVAKVKGTSKAMQKATKTAAGASRVTRVRTAEARLHS